MMFWGWIKQNAHCFLKLFYIRSWDKKGHCALSYSVGPTKALGCTCGAVFWSKNPKCAKDMFEMQDLMDKFKKDRND